MAVHVGEHDAHGDGALAENSSPPLVLVLSSRTAEALASIMEAGWKGPVVVVGTVSEARAALEDESGDVVRAVSETRSGTGSSDRLGITLDPDRQRVSNGSRSCSLTPLEFGVLTMLAQEPGRVQRFADLTDRVWGMPHVGDGGQVHAVIRRVRRKLASVHAEVDILAVRGVGFRLVARRGEALAEGAPTPPASRSRPTARSAWTPSR